MKYGYVAFALVFILKSVPASAFELKHPEREKPPLKIDLEAAPSQAQQDFDKYVQELAAAARRVQILVESVGHGANRSGVRYAPATGAQSSGR